MRSVRIRIPRLVVAAWNFCEEAVNVPVGHWRNHEVRRVDVLLVVLGLAVGIYYGLTTGSWLAAAMGIATFSFVAMIALVF